MQDEQPIKVVNFSSKIIYYAELRRKPGRLFFIEKASHFSKLDKMAMVDKNNKPILHLGGERVEKGGKGADGKQMPDTLTSLKGRPVRPGEKVESPTPRQQKEEARKTQLQENIRTSQAELDRGPAPLPEADQEYISPSELRPEPEPPGNALENVSDTSVI